jgi:4-hydroxy-tetrahydrodipicolinate synthase
LYNNPQVAGNRLSPGLVAELVDRCPNIVGLKDSSGALDLLAACLPLREGAFNAASGSDERMLDALLLGCDACVSGNANVLPELVVALFEAATTGRLAEARKLQETLAAALRAMGAGGDLSLFKSMLGRRGLSVGPAVRAPLLPCPENRARTCWRRLAELDLGW